MTKHFYIKFFILVFLIFWLKVDLYAQSVLSPTEDVCAGEKRSYKVEGDVGSTIYWSVQGGTIYNDTSLVTDEDLVTPGMQFSEVVVSNESIIEILWDVSSGDYIVNAFEETASACVSSDLSLTVTVNSLPDNGMTVSDPSVCPGTTASIVVSNSVSGVDYQLRLDSDDSNVGSAVSGTGGDISFSVSSGVTTTYNVYATSSAGCSVELDDKANVTIADNVNPVAVCQNITIQLDATGNASIIPSQINNGSTDNCTAAADLGLSLDITSFDCSNLGVNSVLLTVTDAAGNPDTCTATVTVEDITDPVADLATLADVTAQCEVTSLTAPTATDNCSSVTVTNDAILPINVQGTTVVTWTYEDAVGNTSTQTQNVVIDDTTDPTIIAPEDVSVYTDAGSCSASSVALGTPMTDDNCGVALVSNDAPATYPLGNTTVTWKVTDNAGLTATTTQVVTVTDNTPPEIPSLSADYYEGDEFQTFIETLIVDTLNYSWGSGAPESTLVGTDDFSVRFHGSVRAAQAGTYTFYTNSDDCVRLWVDGQLIIDNWPKHALVVDEGTITLTAGQVVPIVLEYSEHSGYAIIKLEWEGPGISRQFMTAIQAVTVDLTASGSYDLTVDEVDPGYTDACGIDTRTLSKTNFTCSDLGVNPVTLTVTDVNGNSSSCEINVIVNDTTSPVLADLSDLNIEDCADDESVVPQIKVLTGLGLDAARYSDNCSTDFVVQYRIQLPDASFTNAYGVQATGASSNSDPSGFEFPEGTSTIYFRVLDESGNISNVESYTVSVNHKPNPSEINF